MRIFSVFKDYLVWHYSTAFIDFLHIWWNYFWFINHLFSVPQVFMTWFAPWRRLQEQKVNILKSPEDFFANLAVNFIMRIVGFVVRSALLLIAFIAFLVIFAFGFSFLLFWIVLPVIVAHLFVNGLTLLLP